MIQTSLTGRRIQASPHHLQNSGCGFGFSPEAGRMIANPFYSHHNVTSDGGEGFLSSFDEFEAATSRGVLEKNRSTRTMEETTEGSHRSRIQTLASSRLPSSLPIAATSLVTGRFCRNLSILYQLCTMTMKLRPVKEMHIAGEVLLAAVAALISQMFPKHSSPRI